MVFGLIGTLFRVATFPGLIVDGIVQGTVERSYGVSERRLAVPADEDIDEMDPEAAVGAVRELDWDEDPAEDEELAVLTGYDSVGYGTMLKIVLFPFLLTSLLGVVTFSVTVLAMDAGMIEWLDIPTAILVWLGISVAAHAFPNAEPTDALRQQSAETDSLLRVVGYPLVAVSMLVSLLEFFWIDAIYGVLLWGAVQIAFGAGPFVS